MVGYWKHFALDGLAQGEESASDPPESNTIVCRICALSRGQIPSCSVLILSGAMAFRESARTVVFSFSLSSFFIVFVIDEANSQKLISTVHSFLFGAQKKCSFHFIFCEQCCHHTNCALKRPMDKCGVDLLDNEVKFCGAQHDDAE